MSTTTMEMSLSRCWDWLYCNFKITNAVHEAGPTLDAIDAARPKGWYFEIGLYPDGWYGYANRGKVGVGEIFAPDLLTCWARLCVAMWMADAEGKQ